ncbi:hypothetical protein [Erythrobacter ani]|uniref:GH16 domain-containing protein n=1 Tax=Erythrobacter ani TaxID=2827235 RepID=A0ABS6ST69_9SPHN|nr:hypothetical protein [Erythrobacter ani]MBV7267563.1 hypothetical protein [Erythrobacter ani]
MASQAAAQDGSTNVGEAIAATASSACDRTGCTPEEELSLLDAIAVKVAGSVVSCSGGTWLCVASLVGIPLTLPLGADAPRGNPNQRYEFGDEDPGYWNDAQQDACRNHVFELDPQNNLIVPSLKLSGNATPMDNNPQTFTPTWTAGAREGGGFVNAHTPDPSSVALWAAHKENLTRGSDWRVQFAYYKVRFDTSERRTFIGGSTAFYQGPTLVQRGSFSKQVNWVNNQIILAENPCPVGGSVGGDFNFYWHRQSDECIWYVPNFGLGPTGYAYPPSTAIPFTEWKNYPEGMPDSTLSCYLNPIFIAELTQALWESVENEPGVPAAPDVDVPDVKDGGHPPQIADLAEPPSIPTTPPENPGDGVPPGSGDGGGGDPGDGGGSWWEWPDWGSAPVVEEPGTLDLDFPDWFDLPTFSWGSPTCPTYEAEAFEQPLVLDIHCPLIAENQAVISSLMLVIFSLSAALIVLRA